MYIEGEYTLYGLDYILTYVFENCINRKIILKIVSMNLDRLIKFYI